VNKLNLLTTQHLNTLQLGHM